MSAVTAPVLTPVAFPASDCTGRTVTSGAVCRVSSVNVLSRVSVNTRDPATNATPRTTARALSAIRSLWASRPLTVTRSMSAHPPGGLEVLHPVQHLLGGGVGHLVHDPAVGQEQHPVGVPGGDRVVGDHYHRLAEVPHRAGQEPQHVRAGHGVQVPGGFVG